MKNKTVTLTMTEAKRDSICLSQSKAAAGALTLNGTLVSSSVATLDVPRHVSVYSASDNSAVIFTVTGTNRFGDVITEDITGPNASTVKGNKNFKTITSVTVNVAAVGNVEIGTADEFESQLIPVNAPLNYSVALSSDANLSYRLLYTLDDVFVQGFKEDDATYFEVTDSKSSDYSGFISGTVKALRLEITNFVSGTATLRLITNIQVTW